MSKFKELIWVRTPMENLDKIFKATGCTEDYIIVYTKDLTVEERWILAWNVDTDEEEIEFFEQITEAKSFAEWHNKAQYYTKNLYFANDHLESIRVIRAEKRKFWEENGLKINGEK